MYNLMVQARSHSLKYGFVTMSTAAMYIVMPFLDTHESTYVRDRKYPFFGRYYFDRNSDIIYGICYLSQVRLIYHFPSNLQNVYYIAHKISIKAISKG